MYPQGCGGSSPFFGTIPFRNLRMQPRSTYSEYQPLEESLANLECNLTKQIMTSTGRRFCPVALSANGRGVKADIVLINGKEEHHAEGCYYIEWREAGKRRRQSVGKDHLAAHAARMRKEAELNARAHGVPVPASTSKEAGPSVADSIAVYLQEIKISKTPATLSAYALALQNFSDSCHKSRLAEITRQDLMEFVRYMREDLRLTDRTCYNRRSHVLTFLKANGVEKLLTKTDKVRYVLSEPEIYDEEQLEAFFAACDEEERVFFEFLLMTGFRKKEAAFVEWRDVDLKAGVVRVTAKSKYGFRPKTYEEREVPIPDRLVTTLKARRNGSDLVFPTRNNTPRRHRMQLLDLCKAIATRAKLNPDEFWLHKFRATFATMHLQAGVDLRTMQSWMGHKDLESTMRYLKPARGKGVREKVNATFA
jgi:integrase/recombinase XerD